MLVLITSLNDDVLRCIARRIAATGRVYWFCSTCRAFRDALRGAINADAQLARDTHISTCFTRMELLRHALTVPNAAALIKAYEPAYGYHALILSFDQMYRFTPMAMVHAYRGAPFCVLDYMSPNWRCNQASKPLSYAAAAGRVDVLDEMISWQSDNMCRTGPHIIDEKLTSLAHAHDSGSCAYVHHTIITPAIRYGATQTLEWLFSRLEHTAPTGKWREGIGDTGCRHIGVCIMAMIEEATHSEHAGRMLGYIIDAIAVPQIRRLIWQVGLNVRLNLLAIVLAMLSGDTQATPNAWQWLKQQSFSGYDLWSTIDSMNNHPERWLLSNRRIDARRVLSKLLSSGSASVYRWQIDELEDEQGWLYEILNTELYGLPRLKIVDFPGSGSLPPRVAFAYGTLRAERVACSFTGAYLEARTDCLLYKRHLTESQLSVILEPTSSQELVYMADAIGAFQQRSGEIEVAYRHSTLQWVAEVYMPLLVEKLMCCELRDIKRITKALMPRSQGGYGTCGAAMPRKVKQSISSLAKETYELPALKDLLERAGLWAPVIAPQPLTAQDKYGGAEER